MILNDVSLERMIKVLVGHTDYSLVNPASIDIRVGNSLRTIEKDAFDFTLSHYTEGYPYWLAPGAVALVATLEAITIPNGFVGLLLLKSSRAREGYNHVNAGYIDPGWTGIITLEVMNVTKDVPLPLYPGLKIAQMSVMKMTAEARQPYEGKYKGATCVQKSYHQQ